MENIREEFYSKVGGYDNVIDELIQIRGWINDDNIDTKYLPKGVLFYGESGVGKTLLANCFLNSLGIKVFSLNAECDDIYSNLLKIKEEIKKEKRAALFLDEVDALIEKDYKLKAALVQLMDGYSLNDTYLITVLTTINYYDLPEPLVRQGRVDRKIDLNCYNDENQRYYVFKTLLSKYNFSDNELLALSNEINLKPCEIKSIINDALLRNNFTVSFKDIIYAYKLLNGLEGYSKTIEKNEELRYRKAIHEAGHVILSLKYKKDFSFVYAKLANSSSNNETYSKRNPYIDVESIFHNIELDLAGYYAEYLIFKSKSIGTYNDLCRSLNKARDIVCNEGYFSLTDYDIKNIQKENNNSNEQLRKIEKRTNRILNKASKNVKKILKINKNQLLEIANILYNNNICTIEDVANISIK